MGPGWFGGRAASSSADGIAESRADRTSGGGGRGWQGQQLHDLNTQTHRHSPSVADGRVCGCMMCWWSAVMASTRPAASWKKPR